MQTHALDSSLWELLSHTSHYHAPVSTMCKIFSEAFTKPGYAMEDFLDHTYNTVYLSFHFFPSDVTSTTHTSNLAVRDRDQQEDQTRAGVGGGHNIQGVP
jgi:hypothetical protein